MTAAVISACILEAGQSSADLLNAAVRMRSGKRLYTFRLTDMSDGMAGHHVVGERGAGYSGAGG